MNSDAVIIVGAGWAGLAAALELQQHGIAVTLHESAPHAGGRARTVEFDGNELDNGQHLLIGAYSETLRLLTQLGIAEPAVLLRQRLRLEVLDGEQQLRLSAPRLPAPLHLLWGIISAEGLSSGDKRRALAMNLRLALQRYWLPADISVSELLQRHRQSPALVRRLWEPLCLATLNTPLEQASAQVFLRVLQDSFSRRRRDSDLLVPRVPLGRLFAEHAVASLQGSSHNRIQLRSRVKSLLCEDGALTGLTLESGREQAADVILACGPTASARLLATTTHTAALATQLEQLGSQPITTVYLHYPQQPRPQAPILGLCGSLSQWLFDRRVCGQPGWFAVVISAEGEHAYMDRQVLARRVQQELADILPDWPAKAKQQVVIRERRATFECRVGIDRLRPDNTTPLRGLWLAGDHTATGYPGTLEGAVRSGVECARRIIARRQSS